MHKMLATIVLILSFVVPQLGADSKPAHRASLRPKRTLTLDRGWQFRRAGGYDWHPAVVPGSVFTDLLKGEWIDDPFQGDNEKGMDWVGKTYWIYRTELELTPDIAQYRNIDLVFKGLDTYARVFLNGSQLLSADNMFREWRIACKRALKPGNNFLEIHFSSAINRVLPSLRSTATPLPAPIDPGEKTSPYTRKAPYQYGWDWVPRLLTAGIWKPVLLEA